ncbi:methylmalonyl-CoA mutase family protein [Geminicoccus roseus]|uniref:methylmalonyl-CoA mutase family protein n=1 Tax=Geminicoccus roseus TaxID=404900 RepID=UPI0003F70F31|nr:methylmalonyl-CoA mutase family protein [Geminicoccus roseus]
MAPLPSLAEEFPAPDLGTWRALVEKGLKGADFDQRLLARTEDGIPLPPLFTRHDELPEPGLPGTAPWVRGSAAARTGWDIRALCRLPDPLAANRAILADLAGGASSILLDAADLDPADLRLVLDGVMLDLAPVYLRRSIEDLQRRDLLPAGVIVVHDPVECWAAGLVDAPGRMLDAISGEGFARMPDLRLAVGGAVFDDAGASDAEEIGLTAAAVIGHARRLDEMGVAPELALGRMILGVTTSADFFAGIAKLRALRRLWGRLTEVLGIDLPPVVHATTSARMLARYDASTNLLRNTIAAAAAGMGGADAVTVLPHDHAIGLPKPFAARMARNIQNVLQEESRLGLVADPAGGSWYVEQLTDGLAKAAWAIVNKVEAAGGLDAACRDGLVEALLAERREARRQRIATRERTIVGISRFSDAAERTAPSRPAEPERRLPRVRDAAPFEDLRERVLAAETPPVRIVTLGPATRHAARLGFGLDLFAAAGLRTVVTDDAGSGSARLSVLAGADEDYAEQGPDLARRLAASGEVHLLGRPKALEETLRAAGVTRFVAQGEDMVAYLGEVVERLA